MNYSLDGSWTGHINSPFEVSIRDIMVEMVAFFAALWYKPMRAIQKFESTSARNDAGSTSSSSSVFV